MSKAMRSVGNMSNATAIQLEGVNILPNIKALCGSCNKNFSTIRFNVGSVVLSLCNECKSKLINKLEAIDE